MLSVHSPGDTACGHSFTECELAWGLICILLVTETVACLVSVGELARFLMCTLLVTQTVACLVSVGELAWISMYTLLVTDCGLSYFRG